MMQLNTLVAEPPPLEIADGVYRIRGTRIPLETVVIAFKNGASAEEIVLRYSTLQLRDVYAVISYYLHHEREVDEYLTQQSARSEEVWRELETRFPWAGIRERLLTRRTTQK